MARKYKLSKKKRAYHRVLWLRWNEREKRRNSLSHRFGLARTHARQRKIKFLLCMDDMNLPPSCAADGKPFSRRVRQMRNPSLDRIDNSRPYEPGNVAWVTRHFNERVKRDLSPEDALMLVAYFKKHLPRERWLEACRVSRSNRNSISGRK